MFSDKHKCIFIHINKTAGTSIEDLFKDGYGEGHEDAEFYHKNHSNRWRKYFKFSFVRNPWDKELSDYFFHYEKIKERSEVYQRSMDFKTYLTNMYLNPEGLFGENEIKKFHRNQLGWLSVDGKVEMDFIGKFENIIEDFKKVSEILGIKYSKFPWLNKTTHEHYTKYYVSETKKMIEKMYEKDIEYFKYEFGN